MMDDFYLLLRSDGSSSAYPGNVSYHFYTSLPRPIMLEGKWSVALCELSFENRLRTIVDEEIRVYTTPPPTQQSVLLEHVSFDTEETEYVTIQTSERGSFVNVKENVLTKEGILYPLRWKAIPLTEDKKAKEVSINYGEDGFLVAVLSPGYRYELWGTRLETKPETYKDYVITPGQYSTEESLLSVVNRAVASEKIKFDLNAESHVQLSRLPKGKRVELLYGLEDVLGFALVDLKGEGEQAVNKASLTRGTFALYVYSDLVDPLFVGLEDMSLLRMVPLQDMKSAISHHAFPIPFYLPLSKTSFHRIEIGLCMKTKEWFPLDKDAKVTLTLHFRRM